MSQFELVFEGLDQDSADSLRRVKGAFLAELELSVSEAQHALEHAPVTLKRADKEEDLAPFLKLLKDAGAKVLVVKPKNEANSSDNLFSTNELELVLNEVAAQNQPDSPKEPTPQGHAPSNEIEFSLELAPPAPGLALKESLIEPTSSDEMALDESTLTQDLPPTEPEIKPQADLALAPESLVLEGLHENTTKAPPPPPPATKNLNEVVAAPEPAPTVEDNTPLAHRKKQVKPPEAPPEQEAPAEETATEGEEEEVELTVKPKKRNWLGQQHQETIIPIIVGAIVLGLGNWIYFSLFETGSMPNLEPQVTKDQANEPPVAAPPEDAAKEKQIDPNEPWKIAHKDGSEWFTTEWRLTIRESKIESFSLSLVPKEPPALSAQEIGAKKTRYWVRKVELAELDFEYGEAGFTGRGPARIFLDVNGSQQRLIAQAIVVGAINTEQKSIAASATVTHNSDLDSAVSRRAQDSTGQRFELIETEPEVRLEVQAWTNANEASIKN